MKIKKAMVQSFLAVVLPLIFVNFALAAIYKTVDKNGNVTFTNSRPENKSNEEVKLRSVTPMPPASTASTGRSGLPAVLAKYRGKRMYSLFKIVEPANDATMHNQLNISVKIVAEPGIYAGHKIRLLLDGEVVGGPKRSLTFEIKNVDRGTHILTAEVLDRRRKVVQSTSNTINIHRTIVPLVVPATPLIPATPVKK